MNNTDFMPCDGLLMPEAAGRKSDHTAECSRTGYQYADISIPIEICPETDVGKIETECCGEPYIQCEQEPCGANCNIIITQNVKIKIPVKFGIRTIEGNSYIQCSDCCKK